jgi:hypothetical protein
METKSTVVTMTMTKEEVRELEAFRAQKEKEAREEAARQQRMDYAKMVDEEIALAIPQLLDVSTDIRTVKEKIFENFQTILELKAEMFRTKKGEEMNYQSHSFSNSDGTMRITLGQYLLDNYLDTAEDGVRMIREYIQSLATDEKSQALVGMVMKLLAKDAKGTLKAQRILQLRKIAMDTGDSKFIEGVKIIEEAYRPLPSRTFIRAEIRDEKTGGWKRIPLGMTES